MITRAFLAIFLFLILGLLGFFAISLQNDDVQPIKTQEGKPLILDRELYTIEDIPIDKESLFSGKIILNVYASYCLPCVIEHPFLMEIADSKNVKMVGLSHKDQIVETKKYLENIDKGIQKLIERSEKK